MVAYIFFSINYRKSLPSCCFSCFNWLFFIQKVVKSFFAIAIFLCSLIPLQFPLMHGRSLIPFLVFTFMCSFIFNSSVIFISLLSLFVVASCMFSNWKKFLIPTKVWYQNLNENTIVSSQNITLWGKLTQSFPSYKIRLNRFLMKTFETNHTCGKWWKYFDVNQNNINFILIS